MTQSFSLFELNEHIRRVLALNFQQPVWIIAEIAEAGLSNGHLYLSLVQKSETEAQPVAQAQAIVWLRERRKMNAQHGAIAASIFQVGAQARLLVRVDFHERYGLKLHVADIDPAFSLGQMALQRQQTLDWLRREGLLGKNASLALPKVVQRIAVVTSKDAAGFQDFKTHLAENTYGYQFRLDCFFAAVQGNHAVAEMVQALTTIAGQHERFDAVAILRGGGSKLDLAAFDDAVLCKAVAECPLPVLTGIGHETDESVLDLSAHTALKTPTAVADFLIERAARFEAEVLGMALQMSRLGAFLAQHQHNTLSQLHLNLRFAAAQQLRQNQLQLDSAEECSLQWARETLSRAQRQLDHTTQLLAALHPETVLQRGYSLTHLNGKALRSAQELQPGDAIETQLAEGRVSSRVE